MKDHTCASSDPLGRAPGGKTIYRLGATNTAGKWRKDVRVSVLENAAASTKISLSPRQNVLHFRVETNTDGLVGVLVERGTIRRTREPGKFMLQYEVGPQLGKGLTFKARKVVVKRLIDAKDVPYVTRAMKGDDNHFHALLLRSVRPSLSTDTSLSRADRSLLGAYGKYLDAANKVEAPGGAHSAKILLWD